MSTAIEVYRGDGTRRGDDILEPLLADNVLVIRGTSEMNENAHNMTSMTMEVIFRNDLRLGQIVEALDISTNRLFRAKITGISINVELGNIQTMLNLERPLGVLPA